MLPSGKKARWKQIAATWRQRFDTLSFYKMLTSLSSLGKKTGVLIGCLHVDFREASLFWFNWHIFEASAFSTKELALEQKEEWRLMLVSGTNLQEPACSCAQQQAIKNRSCYFLAINVMCDWWSVLCLFWLDEVQSSPNWDKHVHAGRGSTGWIWE